MKQNVFVNHSYDVQVPSTFSTQIDKHVWMVFGYRDRSPVVSAATPQMYITYENSSLMLTKTDWVFLFVPSSDNLLWKFIGLYKVYRVLHKWKVLQMI